VIAIVRRQPIAGREGRRRPVLLPALTRVRSSDLELPETAMAGDRRWVVLGTLFVAQLASAGGVDGGAAPPTVLNAGQKKQLQQILAPYRADALTAQSARQLRDALRAAGFKSGPALDAELQRHGLSLKAIDAVAGPQASDGSPPQSASSSPARKVPRPQ
jgi:hypothetical protein